MSRPGGAGLSYLSERPDLISGTLAENLRLADPAAGDARLREVLGEMGAGDLLASLPHGLETRLGVGGRQVSAGERQRIALARAVLPDASLQLLDEPTSTWTTRPRRSWSKLWAGLSPGAAPSSSPTGRGGEVGRTGVVTLEGDASWPRMVRMSAPARAGAVQGLRR